MICTYRPRNYPNLSLNRFIRQIWSPGDNDKSKGDGDLYYLIDVERTNLTKKTHFWAEFEWGYTTDIKKAGLYTEEQARLFVEDDINNYTVMMKKETVDEIINAEA